MELAAGRIATGAQTTHITGKEINGRPIEWLPSVPLTRKHKVPPVAGYGILYSEELEQTLHIFQTRDLLKDMRENWRDQALALATDPDCRLYWLEVEDNSESAVKQATVYNASAVYR